MAVVCFHMSDSHSKCEWIEFTNPKAHSAWMDLKKKKQDLVICDLQNTS